jgi:hypothetical protein
MPDHPRRFLIIANKTGQLGNRLTVFAHFLAAGRERGWTVVNPSFCEYAPFFVGTRERLLVASGAGAPGSGRTWSPAARQTAYLVNRLCYKSAHVLHRIPATGVGWARARALVDIRPLVEAAEAAGCRFLFTQNYNFRHHPWCARHADHIRRLLTPIAEHRQAAARILAPLRERERILIGVHIRHGDYRFHLGGRYFYPVSTYARVMRDLAAQLAPRRAAFVVCSNAEHRFDDFAGLEAVRGPGHLVADLHALSRCDYVVGPPSSFNSWAAFHGRCRHAVIDQADAQLSLDAFRICDSPDPQS